MWRISSNLASAETTSVAVTQAYIKRIHTYDEALGAVILIAPDALSQAAASDQRRKAGKALSPLDGVPILLKDNIDVAGLPTTAGSYALAANIPAQDSEVARRLRAAGTVILGKANASQFANFRTTEGFNGSTVGGGTHNPYDLAKSASGSSSGSGIAAAVSFAAGTVGTETIGSITSPASVNGVVGIKPTLALVSRRGIVPISLNLDTAGPMARTVRDAAMLLTVMAGTDQGDSATQDADTYKADYAKALSAEALRGKRLGVMRGLLGYNEETTPLFEEALRVLAAQGAELIEIADTGLVDLGPETISLLLYDFKEDLNTYLASTPPGVKVRSLADLIAFNKVDPRESLHGQNIFEISEAAQDRSRNPEYAKTLGAIRRATRAQGIDRLLREYKVAALVSITTVPAEPIAPDGSVKNHPAVVQTNTTRPVSATDYAALAGYPHLSVPMGQVAGMPVGLSFIGTAWTEPLLLSLGYAYEQASGKRSPPTAYKQTSRQGPVTADPSVAARPSTR